MRIELSNESKLVAELIYTKLINEKPKSHPDDTETEKSYLQGYDMAIDDCGRILEELEAKP